MNTFKPPPSNEAEATYTKAVRAELAHDFDLAFRLYINAAEAFLHLSRSHPTQADKQRTKWKSNAQKSLERAEKIKAFASKQKTVTLTPVEIDRFSDQHQSLVLKRAEQVGDLLLPPWEQPVPTSSTIAGSQPKLSPAQINLNAEWRRSPFSGINIAVLPHEIIQRVITDCSVVASISVLLDHARKFGTFEESPLSKCLNPGPDAGKYYLRFHFNVIDDMLPFHPTTGAPLCMTTTRSGVIWPSLIEKGYMKLMGGYDFPGSDASTDLNTLAGWIPEHILIQSSTFKREHVWSTCLKGFTSGRCVLTLGTRAVPSPHNRGIYQHLLPSHCYSVSDMYEDSEERYVDILDSWHDASMPEPTPQVLRLPWPHALEVFESINLSWNPSIWSRNLTHHGMWKSKAEDEQMSNLQRACLAFDIEQQDSSEDVWIWILLTRHVIAHDRTHEYIALDVQVREDVVTPKAGGTQDLSIKTTYTGSTHTLVRTLIPSGLCNGSLSIIALYDGQYNDVGYTLNAYTEEKVKIAWDRAAAMRLLHFATKVDGAFTDRTAGGNCTYPTFMFNPQYRLHVYPPSSTSTGKVKVVLIAQAARDLPLNITITWANGERIYELAEKEIVTSSGPYGYGFARVLSHLRPGDYTVVLSTFEPRQTGTFSLAAKSSYRVELTAIPNEGAGMYNFVSKGSWNNITAAGGPSLGKYLQNPIYELVIPASSQIRIRLQLLKPSTTYINVSIYPSSSTTTLGQLLCTSGTYDNANSGVVTPVITLSPATYWIIPSTFDPNILAEFRLIVYSSVRGISIQEI